jgi:hypothetical protein
MVILQMFSLLLCPPALFASLVTDVGQPARTESGPVGSKTWVGHYQEVEEYLRTAECILVENYGSRNSQRGPSQKRCTLRPGGPVARMGWKTFPPGATRGFRESYKAEIAAYEVDKLLKMDMVPPTVERELEGHSGAATAWIEGVVDLKAGRTGAPDTARWEEQLARMEMFDALIGNGARNLGNAIRDPLWNLILIDHSRAFGPATEPLPEMKRIDKEFWRRIEGLTRAELDAALGSWLDQEQISAIVDRRERMRAAIGRRP